MALCEDSMQIMKHSLFFCWLVQSSGADSKPQPRKQGCSSCGWLCAEARDQKKDNDNDDDPFYLLQIPSNSIIHVL